MNWPIRNQVLYPMLAVLGAVIACLSIVSAHLASSWVEQEMDRQVESMRETMAASRFPLTDHVLEQMAGLSRAEYVLVDRTGKLSAASHARFRGTKPARWRALASHTSTRIHSVSLSGGEYYHRSFPVDRRPVGGDRVVLHVFFPTTAYVAAWRRAVYPPLLAGAAGLIVVVAVSSFVAHRVTSPLGRLQLHLARVSKGDFELLDVPQRRDEIRELVLAINRMAELLAGYEQEVRRRERLQTLGQLGSSMAHQIRNAATGCRMAIDLHRQQLPDSYRDTEDLRLAIEQLERVENYLERFLRLGRGISGATQGEATASGIEFLFQGDHDTVSIEKVVRSAVRQVDPMAVHLGVRMQVGAFECNWIVTAHEDALEQALVNLLRNAIEAAAERMHAGSVHTSSESNQLENEASPSDGVVALECIESGDAVTLTIRDNGAGPSPAMSETLFEPFVSDKTGGAGLGLALVVWVAESSGGDVAWTRTNDQTCFTMRLPLAAGNGE